MKLDGFKFSNGMEVRQTPLLPHCETVKACDLETKEEVKILTGKQIHVMVIEGVIYASKEAFNLIKQES